MKVKPTYEELEVKLAEYESALERERNPDWEKWLNELADRITSDIAHMPPAIADVEEAARQLRYMATSYCLKANFDKYNLAIKKWWWHLRNQQNTGNWIEHDMESFLREHNIPLEKPLC